MERSERNSLRRQRAAFLRQRRQRRGVIECRVWEQCFPAQDNSQSWRVVSDAVATAVEVTENENISDEQWIAHAIEVIRKINWVWVNNNGNG